MSNPQVRQVCAAGGRPLLSGFLMHVMHYALARVAPPGKANRHGHEPPRQVPSQRLATVLLWAICDGWSPRSPCPFGTNVLAFVRRSALSDRLTLSLRIGEVALRRPRRDVTLIAFVRFNEFAFHRTLLGDSSACALPNRLAR